MSRSLTALRAVGAIIITLISLVTVVVTKIQADDLIVSLPASIGLSYLEKIVQNLLAIAVVSAWLYRTRLW